MNIQVGKKFITIITVSFLYSCNSPDSNLKTTASGNFWGNSINNGPDLMMLPATLGSADIDIESSGEVGQFKDGVGAFRNVCKPSHYAYDDPIVFPGQQGSTHLHLFFGNTATSALSTYESLRRSGNSTCRGGIANRTAYWVPAMIDAEGDVIQPESIGVYYKTGYNGVDPSRVQVIPNGLRMVAGDAMATTAQSTQIVSFQCADQRGTKNSHIINCQNALIMSVTFPQCWDGRNLDSADHKSHMTYPDNGCPTTHPVELPVITYHIKFPTDGSSNGWRLASDMYDGDTMGFSAHGDWFDAWEPNIKTTWTKECLNPGLDCASHKLGDGRVIR